MIRRIIFSCLLLVLPLQMSWAVAGVYCGHEQGSAAQHFGHHEHEHHGLTADSQPDQAGTQVDRDCGYHHQATSQWLPSMHQTPAVFVTAQDLLLLPVTWHAQSILERPERPNWLLAA